MRIGRMVKSGNNEKGERGKKTLGRKERGERGERRRETVGRKVKRRTERKVN